MKTLISIIKKIHTLKEYSMRYYAKGHRPNILKLIDESLSLNIEEFELVMRHSDFLVEEVYCDE